MKSYRHLLAISFFCLLTQVVYVYAQAPVVDNSENFASLPEQQDGIEQPLVRGGDVDNEGAALIKDTGDTKEKTDNARYIDKLQGLQQDLQELRGQLEEQGHTIKLMQQQLLSFYKDLDERIRLPKNASKETLNKSEALSSTSDKKLSKPEINAEKLTKPESKPAMLAPKNRLNPAEEQISYLAAYELVKTKRYDEALKAMAGFLANYPQSGYAPNAQYWLGELNMTKKNYPEAIRHFEIVLKEFSNSNKIPPSHLKIAYALAALGKTEEARTRLQQVIKNYPDTHIAALAKSKLEALAF
ncbi:MAG: tol-pal system protein YbgF [Legionella sp.]